MDSNAIQRVGEMLAEAKIVRPCIACPDAFTDIANFGMACWVHPESPVAHSLDPGHVYWPCCCACDVLVGTYAQPPCTRAMHRAAGRPHDTVALNAVDLASFDAAAAVRGRGDDAFMLITSAAELQQAGQRFGRALRFHPDFATVQQYLTYVVGAACTTECRYASMVADEIEPVAGPQSHAAVGFVVAGMYGTVGTDVRPIVDALVGSGKLHIVNLLRIKSCNPDVVDAAARAMVGLRRR
ncbi:MAG: hypothetical protein WC732_09110 [Candidatus Omnitrophota bacterium]